MVAPDIREGAGVLEVSVPGVFALAILAPLVGLLAFGLYLRFFRPQTWAQTERFRETEEGKAMVATIEQALRHGLLTGALTGLALAAVIILLGPWLSRRSDLIAMIALVAIGCALYLLVSWALRTVAAWRSRRATPPKPDGD